MSGAWLADPSEPSVAAREVIPCGIVSTMSDAARKRPTYADIEALPSHLRGEILGGELVVSPRPAPPHARAASALGGVLYPFDRDGGHGPGGWWIDDEPELHLDVDPDFSVVIPDLGGWRTENLPVLPETAAYTVRPDWVCEVLSPSTAADDRKLKMPFYAAAGVPHLWLVDPLAMTLESFRLERGRWLLLHTWAGEDLVRAEPFEALELRLSALWGGRKPPPRRTA
jgi:Uma2 family endonuclease